MSYISKGVLASLKFTVWNSEILWIGKEDAFENRVLTTGLNNKWKALENLSKEFMVHCIA